MLAQKRVVGHMLHCGSIGAVNDAIGNTQAVGCEGEGAAAWLQEVLCPKRTARVRVSARSWQLLVLLHGVMVLLGWRFTLLLPELLAGAVWWQSQPLTAVLSMSHSQAGDVFLGLTLFL